MSDFKRISAEDAKLLMDQQAVTIADIRDETSFRQSRIDGAVHLNNSNIQAFIESTAMEKPLIVCCYHGHSSLSAAQFLATKGFAEVYSLDGGFEYWRSQFPFTS